MLSNIIYFQCRLSKSLPVSLAYFLHNSLQITDILGRGSLSNRVKSTPLHQQEYCSVSWNADVFVAYKPLILKLFFKIHLSTTILLGVEEQVHKTFRTQKKHGFAFNQVILRGDPLEINKLNLFIDFSGPTLGSTWMDITPFYGAAYSTMLLPTQWNHCTMSKRSQVLSRGLERHPSAYVQKHLQWSSLGDLRAPELDFVSKSIRCRNRNVAVKALSFFFHSL